MFLSDRKQGVALLELGKAIKIVRQAKGLRLAALAKAAGISLPFLSLIEAEERQPSLAVLRRLAASLGVPSEVLIVLAQETGGSLSTTDKRTRDLTRSIRRLAKAQEALREKLKGKDGGASPHARPHRNSNADG